MGQLARIMISVFHTIVLKMIPVKTTQPHATTKLMDTIAQEWLAPQVPTVLISIAVMEYAKNGVSIVTITTMGGTATIILVILTSIAILTIASMEYAETISMIVVMTILDSFAMGKIV